VGFNDQGSKWAFAGSAPEIGAFEVGWTEALYRPDRCLAPSVLHTSYEKD